MSSAALDRRAPGGSSRISSFDGLRGVAAAVVFLHHVLLTVPAVAGAGYAEHDAGPWNWFLYSPLHVVAAGTEAVVVFFVLSGFVLLPPTEKPTFLWRSYYPSRLIRLYLPVVAAVVWSCLLASLIPRSGLAQDPSAWLRVHSDPPTLPAALSNAVLLFGTTELNGPLWSLRWEVVFSLLLPVYVWAALALRRAWLPLLVVSVLAPGLLVLIGAPGLQYLPMFGAGLLIAMGRTRLAEACARVNALRSRHWVWAALAVVAVLCVTAEWTVGTVIPDRLTGLSLCAVVVGAVLWLVIAYGSPAARTVLDLRAVQWLGRISFSFYLVHEPIVVGVAQLLPERNGWLVLLIAAPVSLLLAWGFFVGVERPAHRLSILVRTRSDRRIAAYRPA